MIHKVVLKRFHILMSFRTGFIRVHLGASRMRRDLLGIRNLNMFMAVSVYWMPEEISPVTEPSMTEKRRSNPFTTYGLLRFVRKDGTMKKTVEESVPAVLY